MNMDMEEFHIKKIYYKNIIEIQMCNQRNLPENYIMKYYIYHLTMFPDLNFMCYKTSKNEHKINNFDESKINEHSNVSEEEVNDEKLLVGYVLGKLEVSEEGDGKVMEGNVSSICVDFQYRKKGIARMLMEKLILTFKEKLNNELKSQNKLEIYLKVRISNEVALRFYEKIGFRKVSVEKEYYSDSEDAWKMTYTIHSD